MCFLNGAELSLKRTHYKGVYHSLKGILIFLYVPFLCLGFARFAEFCANSWSLESFSHSITMEV